MAESQQRIINWKVKNPDTMVVRALLISIFFLMLIRHGQTQELKTQRRSTLLQIFKTRPEGGTIVTLHIPGTKVA